MGERARRWKGLMGRVLLLPVSFLGVGLYRAWLSIFFRYGAYPGMDVSDYALFEVSIGLACLAAAYWWRKIVPLWSNNRILILAGIGMVVGSIACAIWAFLLPAMVFVKYAGLAIAGVGLGIAILVWCEFYGALNPMRVALYHAASIFFGEMLCCFFMAVKPEGLVAMSVVLPVLSLWWARRAVLTLPEDDRPQVQTKLHTHNIPWKPIALMATCTFATGFTALPDQPLVLGNIAGAGFACLLVFFGSLSTSRWFNFDTIYRVAFPLMIVGLLLVMPLLGRAPQLAAACYDAGYTMLSMFIMIILSNITYRFGLNAIWLNGIERGIRYLVEALGWGAYALSSSVLPSGANSVVHAIVMVAVTIMFLAIVFQEKSLSARWGINLRAETVEDEVDAFAPGQLSMRVSDLSKRFGLSDREEEVLQLMVRGVPLAQMEEQLFVARGTIKAHTSHIYRKCNVQGKDELFGLLGINGEYPER